MRNSVQRVCNNDTLKNTNLKLTERIWKIATGFSSIQNLSLSTARYTVRAKSLDGPVFTAGLSESVPRRRLGSIFF